MAREYPDRPVVGVGGVLIENGRTLLIKRGSEPLLGQWSIPGGTLELGESLQEGVAREMLEETGLELSVPFREYAALSRRQQGSNTLGRHKSSTYEVGEASFVAWDLLALGDDDLRDAPLPCGANGSSRCWPVQHRRCTSHRLRAIERLRRTGSAASRVRGSMVSWQSVWTRLTAPGNARCSR